MRIRESFGSNWYLDARANGAVDSVTATGRYQFVLMLCGKFSMQGETSDSNVVYW